MARGLAMRVSVSAYLGGVGLAPHSDNQCTVVLQLKGRKRWRLWLRQSAMLPTSSGLLVGRSKVRNPSAFSRQEKPCLAYLYEGCRHGGWTKTSLASRIWTWSCGLGTCCTSRAGQSPRPPPSRAAARLAAPARCTSPSGSMLCARMRRRWTWAASLRPSPRPLRATRWARRLTALSRRGAQAPSQTRARPRLRCLSSGTSTSSTPRGW